MSRLERAIALRVARRYGRLAREGEWMRHRARGQVVVGTGTYGTPEVRRFAYDATKLIVGNFTSIGPGVLFLLGGNHPVDRLTTFPLRERYNLRGAGTDGFPSSNGDIVVGSDVWIGANVTVVSGVKIGDGAVIAAGALVARDVPPYAIAAGVPAKPLRWRAEPWAIEQLLDIAWWNWPLATVLEHADLLSQPVDHEQIARLKQVLDERQ